MLRTLSLHTNLYLNEDILLARREHLNFFQLASVFISLGSVRGLNFLTQVQREKVAKKNFFRDIVRFNAAVNFYNSDYAMYKA